MRGIHPRKGFWHRFGHLLKRLFPERQIHIRTGGKVSFIRFSSLLQITLVFLFLLSGAWATFTTVSYLLHDKVIATKDNQIAGARLAYRSLLGEVAEYQNKFTAITNDLEENHALMLGLVEQNAALQQNLKSAEIQLDTTEKESQKVIATREFLKGQLSDIENEMRSLTSRNYTLNDNLESVETDLQTALAERNLSLFKGNRMRRQIKELEGRLTGMQETEMQAVQRLSEGTATYIEAMEKVVKLTGLKVESILSADGYLIEGRGGPFIAAKPDGLPAEMLKVNLSNLDARLRHSEALQDIMRKLPLTAPLNNYRITSSFGKRRDPINKRWGAHYGLDMGATFKTSVYVTAPGVVTHVGWKGKYGKLIEVDHGAGIKTRYGHLNKTLVKKGEKLKFRQKIGLLGSTGRSTGAHLHYEVVFKGKARNPIKFVKAGRYVFQD